MNNAVLKTEQEKLIAKQKKQAKIKALNGKFQNQPKNMVDYQQFNKSIN